MASGEPFGSRATSQPRPVLLLINPTPDAYALAEARIA